MHAAVPSRAPQVFHNLWLPCVSIKNTSSHVKATCVLNAGSERDLTTRPFHKFSFTVKAVVVLDAAHMQMLGYWPKGKSPKKGAVPGELARKDCFILGWKIMRKRPFNLLRQWHGLVVITVCPPCKGAIVASDAQSAPTTRGVLRSQLHALHHHVSFTAPPPPLFLSQTSSLSAPSIPPLSWLPRSRPWVSPSSLWPPTPCTTCGEPCACQACQALGSLGIHGAAKKSASHHWEEGYWGAAHVLRRSVAAGASGPEAKKKRTPEPMPTGLAT